MPAIVWVYDLFGVQLCALRDIVGLVVEDRLQDVETLSFKVRADDQRAPLVQADVLIRYGTRLWRITDVHQTRGKAGDSLVEVIAEGRWGDLAHISRVGHYTVLGQTATAGLATILFGTGWTVGTTPGTSTLYSLDDTDVTILALVRRWASITNTEVVWDTAALTVSLVATQGADNGVGFRYGRNLTEINRRVEPPFATRLYPYGANDLNISNVNPTGFDFIENYSWYTGLGLTLAQAQALYRKDQVWSDQRYLIAINLYDAAVARLADLSSPRISYECKVLDLYALGLSSAPVAIGDTVHVYDGVFRLDLSTRVVRLKRYPNEPWKDEIELSFLQTTTSNTQTVTTRTTNYSSLALLADQNDSALTLGSTFQSWAAITFTVAGVTTAAVGASFRGLATGSGTIRFEFAIDGIQVGPLLQDVPFTTGQVINFAWPTFGSGIGEGSHLLEWRSRVVSGSGTVAVAVGDGRAWVMSTGAVGVGATTSPNIQVAETVPTTVQTFGDSGVVTLLVAAVPVSTVTWP